MGKSIFKTKGFYISVAIAAIIIYLIIPNTGTREYDTFAQCLTEKGAVMYGADWCHNCQNQKDMFGKSFDQIDYIDCDKNPQACNSAGINGYPTWIIDGQRYEGTQSLIKLATASGCDLVKDN